MPNVSADVVRPRAVTASIVSIGTQPEKPNHVTVSVHDPDRETRTDSLLNLYAWKFPIDLLNKPAPIRRIKFVMTMRKIVKAVDTDWR